MSSDKNNNKQSNNNNVEDDEDEEMTLDSIIDEFFIYEDQRRRFKNDISFLLGESAKMNIKVDLEHTTSNLSVIIGLITKQFNWGSSFTNQEVINFEIEVNQKYYPQKGTRIYCKTPFLNPCLCDGRDFLQDIMGHAWYNQITFIEIAESIIEFVTEIVKQKTNSIYLQRIGKYYLGHIYKYDDIKQFSALVRVPCVQFEDNFFLKLHVRIIGITDAHFLIFHTEDTEKKNMKLIFWSDLQSLVEIKRRKDEKNKLTLKWKNYSKQNGQPQFIEQTFQIPEPEIVIQSILKKIQKFQRIKIWSNSYMNFGNQWDSKKQIIEQLTQKVYKQEEEIKSKFNIENVQKLIDVYNEVIEHYSSVNDYLSDIYLNSLHNLLNRPDVQFLLSFENEKKMESAKNNKSENQTHTHQIQETTKSINYPPPPHIDHIENKTEQIESHKESVSQDIQNKQEMKQEINIQQKEELNLKGEQLGEIKDNSEIETKETSVIETNQDQQQLQTQDHNQSDQNNTNDELLKSHPHEDIKEQSENSGIIIKEEQNNNNNNSQDIQLSDENNSQQIDNQVEIQKDEQQNEQDNDKKHDEEIQQLQQPEIKEQVQVEEQDISQQTNEQQKIEENQDLQQDQ